MSDMIVAVATAFGNGALSIIRVSGDGCINKLNPIFDIDITKLKANTISYTKIHKDNKLIDEVMISIFRAPKSFTGEDMIEITCHGGIIVTNEVVELIKSFGLKDAKRGEYTKRAFINKKINLIQAEAINDIINAKNEMALDKARNSLLNSNTKEILILKENILNLLSKIEVNIDYPEYEDLQFYLEEVVPIVDENITIGNKIIENSRKVINIQNGFNIAIIGSPNVGKSSLLNAIVGKNKAIVTDIPGTTRDIVEASINYNSYTLNFYDTAGIRKTDDLIENIGIKKTMEAIEDSDLILLLLDQNEHLSEDISSMVRGFNSIVVRNKRDLLASCDSEYLSISALKQQRIDDLLNLIVSKLSKENSFNSNLYLSNSRQLSLITDFVEFLASIEKHDNMDILASKLTLALKSLLDILGDDFNEELSSNIFSKFCIGK